MSVSAVNQLVTWKFRRDRMCTGCRTAVTWSRIGLRCSPATRTSMRCLPGIMPRSGWTVTRKACVSPAVTSTAPRRTAGRDAGRADGRPLPDCACHCGATTARSPRGARARTSRARCDLDSGLFVSALGPDAYLKSKALVERRVDRQRRGPPRRRTWIVLDQGRS